MLTSSHISTPKPENRNRWGLHEILLPTLVLVILLVYSLARFYVVSYVGFQHSPSGEILELYVGTDEIHIGDTITAVNGIPWAENRPWYEPNRFAVAAPGELFLLDLEGPSGSERQVGWVSAGFTTEEFTSRLVNTWVLSYIFWLAGTATILLVRPKDTRWVLLAAFNFITAIWFISGSISSTGIFWSPLVLRMAIWLAVPIYIHLHWNFPTPLAKLPRWVWPLMYGLAILLGIANILLWVPRDLYFFGFLVAIVCVLTLLILRFVRRTSERRDLGLLVVAAAAALLPAGALTLALGDRDPPVQLAGYLLSMVALPGAYFYVVYRRQLGGLEVRANRLISLYLFLVLLVTVAMLTFPLVFSLLPELREAGGAIIFTILFTSIFTVFSFERFQTFVERKLLRIPGPPQHVLENFAESVSTSFSRSHLAETLVRDVLPGFLVRQSAMLDFELGMEREAILYSQGLSEQQLAQIAETRLADWVQITLPLTVHGHLRGLWLLGRKDPDDYYSHLELRQLRSLAAQASIALANISQAESLRALHQAAIERREAERVDLARELHDDTLRRIREIGELVSDEVYAGQFGDAIKALVAQVRTLMSGLRPPLLDQGLYYALLDLKDDLQAKAPGMHVQLELAATPLRFDPNVEQHIYRIVQQACENALLYSRGATLRIHGSLSAETVTLTVEDDGAGFALEGPSGLTSLLAGRHFGLAGMHERAAMIGANLEIDASLGKGTGITLSWGHK